MPISPQFMAHFSPTSLYTPAQGPSSPTPQHMASSFPTPLSMAHPSPIPLRMAHLSLCCSLPTACSTGLLVPLPQAHPSQPLGPQIG